VLLTAGRLPGPLRRFSQCAGLLLGLPEPRQHPQVVRQYAPRQGQFPMVESFGPHRSPQESVLEDADPGFGLGPSALQPRKLLAFQLATQFGGLARAADAPNFWPRLVGAGCPLRPLPVSRASATPPLAGGVTAGPRPRLSPPTSAKARLSH
jgi:hypothetical protein